MKGMQVGSSGRRTFEGTQPARSLPCDWQQYGSPICNNGWMRESGSEPVGAGPAATFLISEWACITDGTTWASTIPLPSTPRVLNPFSRSRSAVCSAIACASSSERSASSAHSASLAEPSSHLRPRAAPGRRPARAANAPHPHPSSFSLFALAALSSCSQPLLLDPELLHHQASSLPFAAPTSRLPVLCSPFLQQHVEQSNVQVGKPNRTRVATLQPAGALCGRTQRFWASAALLRTPAFHHDT